MYPDLLEIHVDFEKTMIEELKNIICYRKVLYNAFIIRSEYQ